MPDENGYPESLEEILNDETYREATVSAMEAFRDAKPWSGSVRSRMGKLYRLHDALCLAYGMDTALFIHPSVLLDARSGHSSYNPLIGFIYLRGKLSVLTYLHEFGHSLKGPSEVEACRWSINLFRTIFPKEFASLQSEGHFLTDPAV